MQSTLKHQLEGSSAKQKGLNVPGTGQMVNCDWSQDGKILVVFSNQTLNYVEGVIFRLKNLKGQAV